MKRLHPRAGWLLESVLLLGLVGVWQAVTSVLRVPPYLVPQPTALAMSLSTFYALLLGEAAQTLVEAAGGFLGGNLLGLGLAIVFVYSRTLERALLPWMVVLKTLPIVAITPLITLLLGFGAPTMVAIATLVSFFPALVNGVRGLRLSRHNRWNFYGYLTPAAGPSWCVCDCRRRYPTSLPPCG